MKLQENFIWIEEHQQVFEGIRYYLTQPLILVLPWQGIPLKLYLSATEEFIRSLLAHKNEKGVEQAL